MEKAEILTFVNAVLGRSETDIDVEIQIVLDDLSKHNLLTAEDTDQTLESGDTYLEYPTGFKQLVSIVLNDGTYDGPPLKKIPGGHKEYRQWMEDETSTDYSEPEWYSEYDSKFFVYHPADGDYTSVIEYYKYHPQDVNTIEFGDEFKNCIKFGTAFEVACAKGLSRYISIWGPRYEKEKLEMIDNSNQQPYIVQ